MLLPSRLEQDGEVWEVREDGEGWEDGEERIRKLTFFLLPTLPTLPTPPHLSQGLLSLIINLRPRIGDKMTVLLGIPEGIPDGTIGFMIVLA